MIHINEISLLNGKDLTYSQVDWWAKFESSQLITLTPYMVLPLFATRFADYAGGIRVSFM